MGLWSAQALIDEPERVTAVHRDFIDAGADVITADTYAASRRRLPDPRVFARANRTAGEAAVRARNESGWDVLIAGSLGPIHGSYRPDRVRPEPELVVFSWPANGGGGERFYETLHGKASYLSDKSDAGASTEALDRMLLRLQHLLSALNAGVYAEELKGAVAEYPDNPELQRAILSRALRGGGSVPSTSRCWPTAWATISTRGCCSPPTSA